MHEYVVPQSALTVEPLPYEKTDAEYRDMCRTRMPKPDEPESIKVLRAHEQMVIDARAERLQAEIDEWNADHPLAPTGEQPAHLMEPFTAVDLDVVEGVKIYGADEVRVPYLIKQVEAWHARGEHSGGIHPFCTYCRTVETYAESSLRWWLAGHPRADVPRGQARSKTRVTPSANPYLTVADLVHLPDPEMMIEEFVPMGGLGYITGRDASFKTFLALDFAMGVTTFQSEVLGRPLKVRGYRNALYLAGEGVRSFRKRIAAWVTHHGVPYEDVMAKALTIRNGTVDLYAGASEFEGLLAHIRATEPDLIVVDTLNRSAGAAEQNSASDMSVITGRLAKIKEVAGDDATVIVIAHTDKGDNDARGSSSIEDDADFVLHCKKVGTHGLKVDVAKMKDGESGQSYEFGMVEVDGGPGPSLVITTERIEEPQWLSDSVSARVLGVLVAAQRHDPLTRTQINTAVRQDGTGKDASDTAIRKALTDLIDEGKVDSQKIGDGLTSPRRYWAIEPHDTEETP